jgi:hypothetical protein
LIVQIDPDGKPNGGDTAQREGWYWLGVWLRQHTPGASAWTPHRKRSFREVLNLLEPNGDGIFYRHPKLPPWNDPFSKEWGTSRDQLVPLIAAMGLWGETERLRRLWDALPEDAVGKHAFNGNWRNFLGQDGWNCTEVKHRSCSPSMDCSIPHDDRDCALQVDSRSCPLSVDRRDCSIFEDRRDCSQPHDNDECKADLGFGVKGPPNSNPLCVSAREAQNLIYEHNREACEIAKAAATARQAPEKVACETEKSAQNVIYSTQKTQCEAAKVTQNALYATQKAQCETGKAAQNAQYGTVKGLCETAKTGGKLACEAYKAAATQLCRLTNVFSGDIMGPSMVNLFRRAVNESPDVLQADDILSPTIVQGGTEGEIELAVNTKIRIDASHNRDNVGDDLNHIVLLIMAKLRYRTTTSDGANHLFATQKVPSYGSYLGAYYAHYGTDFTDMNARMDAGIAAGWKPDASPAYGAVRWYHRPGIGANPGLAALYSKIVDYYVK